MDGSEFGLVAQRRAKVKKKNGSAGSPFDISIYIYLQHLTLLNGGGKRSTNL